MDGWVKIGTELDTKPFDAQIKEVETQLEEIEHKLKQDEIEIEIDTKTFDAQINYLEEKLNALEQDYEIGLIVDNESTDYMLQYAKEIETTKNKLVDLKNKKLELEQTNFLNDKDIIKLEAQYEKLSQKLSILKTKQLELNKNDFSNVEKSIKNVGNKVDSVVKKVAKWGMAVFGIRTAYSLVQKAMNIISQSDDQVKADIEYISYALASTLKPIVDWLIKGVYTLLTYVNYLAQAWFGVNLFANASVDAFKKATNQAKELKKTTQGFDEMNIQQDTSSSSTSSATPSFDLSSLEDVPIPSWLEWIVEHKDEIIIGLGIIVGLLTAGKLLNFFDKLSGIKKILDFLSKKLGKIVEKLGTIKSFGLLAIIIGIVLLIGDLIGFIKDPSWSGFVKIVSDIAIILGGLITLLTGNWMGLVIAGIGLIIRTFACQKDAILSVEDATKNLQEAQKNLENANDSYISSIEKSEEALRKLEETEKTTGLSGENLYNQVKNGTLDYKDMTQAQRDVYKAYLENDKAQKDLKTSTDTLTQAKKDETLASWDNQLAIASETGNYDEYKKAVVDAFKKGELSSEEARDLIEKSMSRMSDASQKTFMEDLPDDIKNGMDPDRYQTYGQGLKNWFGTTFSDIGKGIGNFFTETLPSFIAGSFESLKTFFGKTMPNFILEKIEAMINGLISGFYGMINKLISGLNNVVDMINKIPGINIGKINLLSVPYATLPRLKTGGIINLPSKGVPVGGGSAIGGESGAEGVIPLTDSQAMETLGSTIGRYITINATIENKMDSRVIGRQVQRIQAENDFLMNR